MGRLTVRPVPATRAAVARSYAHMAVGTLDRHRNGDLPDGVRREVVGALVQAIAELGGDVEKLKVLADEVKAGEGGEGC